MLRLLFSIAFMAVPIAAQIAASPGFTLEKSVIANGGGISVGPTFSVAGTAGQVLAEESSSAGFSVRSGFWSPAFAPTAAGATLAGVVRTTGGAAIPNALVVLTDSRGVVRTARTTSFGRFSFDGVETGQTVILNLNSRRFAAATQVLFVGESLLDIDLIATP